MVRMNLNWSVLPRGIKMVLLDHDDTLVRTFPAKWAAHRQCALTHYGVQLTDEMFRRHWGKPLPVMTSLLYGDPDHDRALDRYMAMQHAFPKELFDDTLPVLGALRGAGLRLGVVTATSRNCLTDDWEELGIDPEYFNYTQAYEHSEWHKP